jgi:hypothetical protein
MKRARANQECIRQSIVLIGRPSSFGRCDSLAGSLAVCGVSSLGTGLKSRHGILPGRVGPSYIPAATSNRLLAGECRISTTCNGVPRRHGATFHRPPLASSMFELFLLRRHFAHLQYRVPVPVHYSSAPSGHPRNPSGHHPQKWT